MPKPTKSTAPYPSFQRGFEAMGKEHGYWVEGVEGTLPADLEGTFFRNGPGRTGVGGERFGHWFDGDGMVCAFTFKQGRIHFRNRYVRTPKYIRETGLGRVACRGFGTQRRGGILANALRPPARC